MARILIVDDEESIRFTLSSFLEEAGHEVRAVPDCREALAALDEAEFEIVFADIVLGEGNGIDILKYLRSRNSTVQFILITGYPEIETASEAVRLGAFDYMTKPVTQEKVLRSAELALRHQVLESEKERYRSNLDAIFRSVRDPIIAVNPEFVVTEINDAAMHVCGISPGIVGESFRQVAGGCTGQCLEILEETLEGKKPSERARIECQRAGGPRYVLSIACYPLRERTGRFRGAVMVCRDETRLVELETRLHDLQRFQKIIGSSPGMQKVYGYIEALAGTQTTVLIRGESGTGKELVAEALHAGSPGSNRPFIRVNCSALAESLLESELFGHAKGSFTGAYQDYTGRFQRAHGGTIFLDEIGDVSPKIQLGLLRVLQEKEIERIGDPRPIKLDVRIVAATNRDLQELVGAGRFRQDLYFRLKVVEIMIPPLRERREDIPLLVRHFIEKFNRQFGKGIENVSDNVLRGLREYDWPGNVRELEHAIEHAFVLCRDSVITLDYLPPELASFARGRYATTCGDTEAESRLILETLSKTGGNKARAARMLGIDRKTLYRKLRQSVPGKPL